MGVCHRQQTHSHTGKQIFCFNMDAIRKKMQSLKGETDGLYQTIAGFEDKTAEYNKAIEQADCDIRDYGKKVQQLEISFDETNDQLQKSTTILEEKEKTFKEVEADAAALSRRIMLMEEEAKKSDQNLLTLSPSWLCP